MAREQEAGEGGGSEPPVAQDGPPGAEEKGPIATLGKTLFRMRLALTRALSADAAAEPAPALPAQPAETGADGAAAADGHVEFSELLGALGAEPSDVTALERKEREIAELRANLQMLRPIGDELARVEQQRLAEKAQHEREVAELRQQIDQGRTSLESAVARHIEVVQSNIAELEAMAVESAPAGQAPPAADSARGGEGGSSAPEKSRLAELELALEESRAEVCRLSGCVGDLSETLSKRSKALDRSQVALASLRERFAERKRLASERWHELRELKKRLRELDRKGRSGA